jgi:hypothetical protein
MCVTSSGSRASPSKLRIRIDRLVEERDDLETRLAESRAHLNRYRGAEHELGKTRVELLLARRENARLRKKVSRRDRLSRRLLATAERT